MMRDVGADHSIHLSDEPHIFADLFELDSDACALLDDEFRVLRVNRSFTELFGWSAAAAAGERIEELIVPKAERPAAGEAQALQRYERVSTETVRQSHSGSLLEVWLTAAPYRTADGALLIYHQYRDISEGKCTKRELEEALASARASERRFHELFDHAADALFLTDRYGKFLDVNQRACESLQFSRDELLTMSVHHIEQQFAPKRMEECWEQLQDRRSITINGIHRRRDGTLFPVELSLRLLELDGNEVMLASARDLSEREELEQQLRQAQKLEAVGRLAGGIAHDFNNALTAIHGNAAMALSADLPNEAADDIREVIKAADRAAGLTRQLLAYSRKQVLQPRRLRLNHVVTDLLKMLRRMIPVRIELETRLSPDAPDVHADLGQLEQVLMNLTVNASDAMPRGGTISIETTAEILDSTRARSLAIEPGPYAVLKVHDTGTGIPHNVLPKIFEPYFTTKPLGKGTGLGLATVYGIVSQSGGGIDVKSTIGEGTRFDIYLPAAREGSDDAKEAA
jgi:two-component system, cell cycle sensor histidine kinase and response regulator CckA